MVCTALFAFIGLAGGVLATDAAMHGQMSIQPLNVYELPEFRPLVVGLGQHDKFDLLGAAQANQLDQIVV